MKMFIDLDLRQVVSGPGDRTPLPVIQASSQDTLEIDAYYVQGGQIVDPGAGVALRFGLFKTGTTTPALALVPLFFPLWDNTVAYVIGDQVTRTGISYICITANTGNDPATTPADWTALPPSTWVRKQDSDTNFYWQGFLILNTTQMAADVADTNPLLCTGEFRYQLSDGEIVHSIYIPFSIFPALVTETGVPPVTVIDTYPDASTIELTVHKGAAGGYAPLDGGSRVPLLNLPANTEFQSNKDAASGYAGLDLAGKLKAAEFNIDNSTLIFDPTSGQLEVQIDRKTLVVGGDGTIQAVGSITIQVGTVTVLPSTSLPTASITGTAPNYLINLGIPAGPTGTPGTNGVTPTFTLGSVTTLAPGAPATVTVTGTPPAYVLNFGIPRGADGSGGVSTLVDAETSEGLSIISDPSGIVKRFKFDASYGASGTSTEILVPPPPYSAITGKPTTFAPDETAELIANKGVANGYASLDSLGKVPAGQIPGGAGTGGGAPILGGIVKTAVTLPTWTHGNTFDVNLTNTDFPLWLPNSQLAIFMSADGMSLLGIVPVVNSVKFVNGPPAVFGITCLISDAWFNNFTTGVVIPAGALVYYMSGMNTCKDATGMSLVVDTQTHAAEGNIGFYPSMKGVTSADGSVKFTDNIHDLDFKVSPPAFAGFIPAPVAQAYTVDLAASSTYKIVKIYLKTNAGTCTVALNRNGSALTGASAIAVSSTRTSVVLSQVVAVDDVIEIVVSNVSSAVNLAYSVRTQPN